MPPNVLLTTIFSVFDSVMLLSSKMLDVCFGQYGKILVGSREGGLFAGERLRWIVAVRYQLVHVQRDRSFLHALFTRLCFPDSADVTEPRLGEFEYYRYNVSVNFGKQRSVDVRLKCDRSCGIRRCFEEVG